MITVTLVAALVVLSVAHSVLGERRIITPLLAGEWPRLGVPRAFGKRTIRFAWHLTSLAWLALAAVVVWPGSVQLVVSGLLLTSGVVAFVAGKGRHFAWAFFASAGVVGLVVDSRVEPLLGPLAALVLGSIAALHVAWAAGLRWGLDVAVPTVDGAPTFRPGRVLTLAVAAAFAFGAVVALRAGTGGAWRWLAAAGALVCGVRAIGDLRHVGLFKRTTGTGFSRWDDVLFTPVCVGLATCFAVVAR